MLKFDKKFTDMLINTLPLLSFTIKAGDVRCCFRLMLPVIFKIKARELTMIWMSKARVLKSKLLELFSSSEKTAPSVITIRLLSTAGSTAPGHTNNNILINNVSDRHVISLSEQNLQVTFRLQADP